MFPTIPAFIRLRTSAANVEAEAVEARAKAEAEAAVAAAFAAMHATAAESAVLDPLLEATAAAAAAAATAATAATAAAADIKRVTRSVPDPATNGSWIWLLYDPPNCCPVGHRHSPQFEFAETVAGHAADLAELSEVRDQPNQPTKQPTNERTNERMNECSNARFGKYEKSHIDLAHDLRKYQILVKYLLFHF